MKFVAICYTIFVVASMAFAVPPTVTGPDAAEIQQIIDSIYHPSTDPVTAAALEEMLLEALGIEKAVIEDSETAPIDIEAAIIDESIVSEPGQDQISPIGAEPVIIDESFVSEHDNYRRPSNANSNSVGDAVVLEQSVPVKIPAPEVVVVEQPEIFEEAVFAPIDVPEEVIVAELPIPVKPVSVNTPDVLYN